MIHSKFQALAARISIFSAVSYAVAHSSQLVDIFWVSKLGAGAPTAIAIVAAVFFIALTLNEVIGVSSVALLSQSLGRGDKLRTAEIILQTFLLKFVFGLCMAGIFIFVMNKWLSWFTSDLLIQQYIVEYTGVIWLSLILVPVNASALTILRIIGSEKATAQISIAALIINASLTPVLIFGLPSNSPLELRAMGIAGAAWASVLTELLVGIIAIRLVVGNRVGIALRPNRIHWEPGLFRDFLLIGLPIAGVMLLFNLERAIVTALVARQPVAISDGFAIGLRIFTFYGMGAFGVALGAAVAVGRYIGEDRVEQVKKELPEFSFKVALAAFVLYVPVLFFPNTVVTLFSDNVTTIAAGALYLQFMCAAIVMYCVYYVFNGAFEGAGRNLPVLHVALMAFLVEVPLLYLADRFFSSQLWLIWLIVLIAVVLNAAGLVVLFRRGHWLVAEAPQHAADRQ